jgi:hypothetical protein
MKKQLLCFIILAIFGSANAQVPSYVPTNGLVGWWPFNGNANDESGNGNHGTVNGGVSNTSDRAYNLNSAFRFNGIDGVISVPSLNSLSYSPISYSAWIILNTYLPSGNGFKFKAIIGRNTASVEEGGVIGIFSDGFFNNGACDNNLLMWRGGPFNGDVPHSGAKPDTNKWCHVVYTQDYTGKWNWYINGKKTSSGTFINLQNHYNFFQIGSCNNQSNSNTFWDGKLDDIGIWNRALDSNEVKLLYNGCNKSITLQPINQGMFSGNALFTCASNDTLLTFQWQSNSGMGWNNLSNAGQYNGANTDSLIVNNVSSANNNQLFRCIIKGNCLTDTTQEATLRVWGLGINGVNLPEFKLYPNPSSNAVTIAYSQNPYSIAVYNSLGQMVLSQSALSNEHTFDISQWPKGVYFLELIDAATQTNKVQKLIRN